MWFQPLPAIVLASLILFASVCAANRVAVAFVDVKFDDKAAIWSLMLDRRYDKVIAITEGIDAHGKAAKELTEYLQRQNVIANVRVDPDKLKVYRGSTVFREPVKHEAWWIHNTPLEVEVAKQAALRRELQGNQVRIFQLAPTAIDDVRMVIKSADPNSIETYMLLHGYNSRQETMERQTYFLRNLRSWVTETNPNAHVIFTSSMDSYAARDGGKQPVTAIKDMFPKYDLDQAANDNFWARQLRKAYQTGLTDEPFPIQDDAQLERVILAARMHPEENERWRADILNYIRRVLDRHPPNAPDYNVVLRRLKYTLLPEFSKPTTLELADAAHVAAFHRYLDGLHYGQNTGLSVVPVVYPNGDHAEDAAVPFQPTDANEFHGLLLKGADRDIDLSYIKRLAGLPH